MDGLEKVGEGGWEGANYSLPKVDLFGVCFDKFLIRKHIGFFLMLHFIKTDLLFSL